MNDLISFDCEINPKGQPPADCDCKGCSVKTRAQGIVLHLLRAAENGSVLNVLQEVATTASAVGNYCLLAQKNITKLAHEEYLRDGAIRLEEKEELGDYLHVVATLLAASIPDFQESLRQLTKQPAKDF